jgi:repressor LexA
MHKTQQKILEVIKDKQPVQMSFKEFGEAIGEAHLQNVKHHLQQLVTKNFVIKDPDGFYRAVETYSSTGTEENEGLLAVPIYGAANCGPAELLAEDKIEGHIFISPTLLNYRDGMIAVRAEGTSMNKASIKGQSIEPGDYLIVDTKEQNPQDGDYVLSVIDEMANVKRLFRNQEDNSINLVSESSKAAPPIVVTEASSHYFVCGKVIRVVKTFQKKLG